GDIVVRSSSVRKTGDVAAQKPEAIYACKRRNWNRNVQTQIFVRLSVGQKRRVIRSGYGINRNSCRENRNQIVSRRRRNIYSVNEPHQSREFRVENIRRGDSVIDRRKRVKSVFQF